LESLSQSIHQPLEFLIYTSIILLIITGVFLIKLLIDLSGLVKTMQGFVKVIQEELEPVIKEIKTTLININQISSNVVDQVNNMNSGIKKGANAVLDATAVIGSRAKEVGKIIGKNLLSSFYLLMNLKK